MTKKLLIPLAIALFATWGAATLSLRAVGLRTYQDWELVLAIVAVGVKTLLEPAVTLATEVRGSKRNEQERDIALFLRAELLELLESSPTVRGIPVLKWNELALNVFVVDRAWWKPWRPVLRRVGRERFAMTSNSGVTWTKGKGVIGRCWELNEDLGRDFATDYAQILKCTQDEWEALPADFRQGLSYWEFQRTKTHAVVVAVPIQNGKGSFVGCISVDAPSACYDVLWRPQTRDDLRRVGNVIRAYLRLGSG